LGKNEFILNLVKFEKVKPLTFENFEKLINETPKTFFILFKTENVGEYYSELQHAMFDSQVKCEGNVEIDDQEIPIFHYSQLNNVDL
jgi:hypothetical protein